MNNAVEQLSVGERAKITVPSSLAYKEKGFPGLIPPHAKLIFDLELINFS